MTIETHYYIIVKQSIIIGTQYTLTKTHNILMGYVISNGVISWNVVIINSVCWYSGSILSFLFCLNRVHTSLLVCIPLSFQQLLIQIQPYCLIGILTTSLVQQNLLFDQWLRTNSLCHLYMYDILQLRYSNWYCIVFTMEGWWSATMLFCASPFGWMYTKSRLAFRAID